MKVHHILISFLLLAEPDHISGKLTRVRGGKSKDYANEKERNEDVNVVSFVLFRINISHNTYMINI